MTPVASTNRLAKPTAQRLPYLPVALLAQEKGHHFSLWVADLLSTFPPLAFLVSFLSCQGKMRLPTSKGWGKGKAVGLVPFL
jgi:hypothetical protein